MYLLFESLRPEGEEQTSFSIEEPDEVLQCTTLDEVHPLLEEVERRVRTGSLAAGFVTYEAGYAFLPNMPVLRPGSLPLAWFALTKNPRFLPGGESPLQPSDSAVAEDLRLNRSLQQYSSAIESVKNYIERGDTYQVNYTMRYRGTFTGSPLSLYRRLQSRQKVNYAALIETDDWVVLSLSPELFFRKSGRTVTMRPMKGTIARGRTLREDEEQARVLRESAKETAENLMIVDLLRNDLGKISEPGSIEVLNPMQVERYETLLQMTTTIQGQLRTGVGIANLFAATFPSGSVTGAPKVRTMQIIHELESEPRGVYTGAVGYAYGDVSVFNVAIRTVLLDRIRGELEMGAGSGILYEADPVLEYRECELKARFLNDPRQPFRLFETLLWTPADGYSHLDFHLDRIVDSAAYFLYPANRLALCNKLENQSREWESISAPLRVRMLLDENGTVELEFEPLHPLSGSQHVCLSERTVNSADPFLFHKTTNRAMYDSELNNAKARGFFDCIFRNERNEITEGAISNVVIRKGDAYFTPPVECGLLAGTARRHLLETQSVPIRDRILQVKDLLNADAIFMTNALRGMVRVNFSAVNLDA